MAELHQHPKLGAGRKKPRAPVGESLLQRRGALDRACDALRPSRKVVRVEQVAAADQHRRRCGETVHRAGVARFDAVHRLRPVMAVEFRRPDELRPQRRSAFAKRVSRSAHPACARTGTAPPASCRDYPTSARGSGCPGCHRSAYEGAPASTRPARARGRASGFRSRPSGMTRPHRCRPLPAAPAVREQRLDARRVVARKRCRAQRLQVMKRPDHAAGAVVERRRGCCVAAVRRRADAPARTKWANSAPRRRRRCGQSRHARAFRPMRWPAVPRGARDRTIGSSWRWRIAMVRAARDFIARRLVPDARRGALLTRHGLQ